MFDIGFWELVLVALVALLSFGPKELAHLVRDAALLLRRLRAATHSAGAEIRRELHMDDVDSVVSDVRRDFRSVTLSSDPPPSPPHQTPKDE